MKEYKIDLTEKSLGRSAAETARILRGKNSPSFQPNQAPDITVKVSNVSKLKLSEKQLKTRFLKRYSGYPSGLKIIPLEKSFQKDPAKVFYKAVERMLPRNRLRKKLLKNLKIEK